LNGPYLRKFARMVPTSGIREVLDGWIERRKP
jgi:hypothetical protein